MILIKPLERIRAVAVNKASKQLYFKKTDKKNELQETQFSLYHFHDNYFICRDKLYLKGQKNICI